MITQAEVQAIAQLLNRAPMSLPEQIWASQFVNKLLELVPSEDIPDNTAPVNTGGSNAPSADESAGKVD